MMESKRMEGLDRSGLNWKSQTETDGLLRWSLTSYGAVDFAGLVIALVS